MTLKDLSKHIEYLLLDHECVIFPQLGAFITSYISSKWSQEEDIFLPPYRTVWFNPQIKEDDHLFISTLARRYRISETDATLLCNEYLEEIYQELEENGIVDVGSIGTFIREEANSPITFAPNPSGVTSPSLYGLDVVHLPLLSAEDLEKSQQKARETEAETRQRDEKHITIRIHRSLINYATAAAASVIMFLGFSTPAANTGMDEEQQMRTELFIPSNLRPTTNIVSEAPAETVEAPEIAVVEMHPVVAETEPEVIEAKIETPAEATQNATLESASSEPSYAIVLASAISLKNAQNYVESLRGRGHKAQLMDNGKMVRVVIPGYHSPQEVRQAISQLKAESHEFDKAWMLEINK